VQSNAGRYGPDAYFALLKVGGKQIKEIPGLRTSRLDHRCRRLLDQSAAP
jgi:hypothetical protein